MAKKSPKPTVEEVKPQKLLAAPKPKAFSLDNDKKPPVVKAAPKKPVSHFWFRELSTLHFAISQIALLLAGLLFLAELYLILNPDTFKAIQQDYKPVTSLFNTLYVTLDQPDDNSLVFNSSIVISGKTTPKSTVIISSATHNMGTIADAQGSFSAVFPLDTGLNLIQISVFDSKGNTKIENRSIYYSLDKL